MDGPRKLQVRVAQNLVLDAGTCEQVAGPYGQEWLIEPPTTTMFHQVLDWLRAQPDPPKPPSGSFVGREGVAAAALTLRWGSWLAVLLDADKPLWSEVKSPHLSRIADEEMARINIEASAALAEWIDLYREDPLGPRYQQLVNRAVAYLPMPKKSVTRDGLALLALALPELDPRFFDDVSAARMERALADAEHHPARLLANAFVNMAWRNGPVEDVHAGCARGLPLDQRGITPADEREILVHASACLRTGMEACLSFTAERPPRPWSAQVLPFGLADRWLVTPSRWSLTETSRTIHLPA